MNSEQICFVVLVIAFVSTLVVLGPLYVAYEQAVAEGTVEELKGYPGFALRLFAWVAQGVDSAPPDAATRALTDDFSARESARSVRTQPERVR